MQNIPTNPTSKIWSEKKKPGIKLRIMHQRFSSHQGKDAIYLESVKFKLFLNTLLSFVAA